MSINDETILSQTGASDTPVRRFLFSIGGLPYGYALFRELKLLKSDLPIIISSGFGDSVVTTRVPAEEIAGLVSKPYRFDQLRDVLKKVVEGN
jgi:FixJ family two-component response regulator